MINFQFYKKFTNRSFFALVYILNSRESAGLLTHVKTKREYFGRQLLCRTKMKYGRKQVLRRRSFDLFSRPQDTVYDYSHFLLYAYAIRWPDILLPFTGFCGIQFVTLIFARSSVQPQPFVQDNRLV